MKEPVVVAHSGDSSTFGAIDGQSGWSFLFLVGTGLMFVGLIDVALLFFPPQWDSLSWEFGTVSALFEGMPLLTMGFGLMTAASVANGWIWTRRLMLTMGLIFSVLIILMAVIFALDVPVVLQATADPAMKRAVKLSSLKTGLMAFTYFTLYLALGIWTWRRMRSTRGS